MFCNLYDGLCVFHKNFKYLFIIDEYQYDYERIRASSFRGSANVLKNTMRLIIFDDYENSFRSLQPLNRLRSYDNRRFWEIEKFHKFIYEKSKELLKERTTQLELIRTYVYTGEYNPKAINNLNRICGNDIRQLNDLIKREEALLQKIREVHKEDDLRKQIEEHVNYVKTTFMDKKQVKLKAIDKHSRGSKGQLAFFNKLRSLPFLSLRTRPLIARNGFIQQKGVDVKLSTDLLQLANNNAYDVALMLTGDSDLTESIQVVRGTLGRIIILCAYFDPQDSQSSTISADLIKESDYFINIKDFNEEEIQIISEKLTSEGKTQV